MQNTGQLFLTLVLVSSGKEYPFLMDVIVRGSQKPFSCVLGHFRHGDNRTPNQPGDPSASLLLTSEKAVFAKLISTRKARNMG